MMLLRGFSARTGLAALLACLACSGGDDDSSGDRGGNDNGGNVDFAVTCSVPMVCGGDPTGTWDLAESCVQPSGSDEFDCDWERTARGTVTGTVTFESGSYSIETDAELRHCGWVSGSGRSSGGTYAVVDDTITLGSTRTLSFCVEADTLWLWDMAASFPDFSVHELERSNADVGG